MLTKFEDSLFIKILLYLTPNELLVVQSCSRQLSVLANSCILWSNHLNELWSDIDESSQPTLIDKIIEEVPLNMIVKNLKCSVYFDESKIESDLDYFRLCMSRLLFRHLKSSEKIHLPVWSYNINLYKASYFFSKYEMKRASLLISDIVDPYKWKCYFKHSLEEQYAWECIFNEDGTLNSAIHEKPMIWRVTIFIA